MKNDQYEHENANRDSDSLEPGATCRNEGLAVFIHVVAKVFPWGKRATALWLAGMAINIVHPLQPHRTYSQ